METNMYDNKISKYTDGKWNGMEVLVLIGNSEAVNGRY